MRTMALATLILMSGSVALAQEGSLHNSVTAAQRLGPVKPGKVVSKVHQPVGTPHKVSSFAPRKTNKRVYGAPIQAPIVHSQPAPK
jgi:small ligand-binding sensory domain FIST